MIFSNSELRSALKYVRRKRFVKAETILQEALARTQEREEKAQLKATLHPAEISSIAQYSSAAKIAAFRSPSRCQEMR